MSGKETKFPVYFDPERRQLYFIEWDETGNSDIPHRIYIQTERPVVSSALMPPPDEK